MNMLLYLPTNLLAAFQYSSSHLQPTTTTIQFQFSSSQLLLGMSSSSSSWNESDSKLAREKLNVWPLDEYNIELLNQVHPKSWTERESEGEQGADDVSVFDLVVIGSGAGGLVSSKQAARRGVKNVALISEHLAGGDCLNVGCVPSKALIRSAKAIREVRRAQEFGVVLDGDPDNIRVDFDVVMSRMRRLRAKIAPVDSHQATEEAGARVYQGRGQFTSPNTISVNGKTLQFKKAIIATGGRASIPPIRGLKKAPYVTNAELFNLTKLPTHLVVIGSGVVALEMAQTFRSFGSNVTVLNRSAHLFPRTDPDVGGVIEEALISEGVDILYNFNFDEVKSEFSDNGGVSMTVFGKSTSHDGTTQNHELACDVLLVAAGRTPNIESLGIETAGINHDKQGITVDDFLRTSNENVYAVGDCVSGVPRLTHMSGEMAKVAVQNSIFNDSWKLSSLVVPATMYTEPEYASVGHTRVDDNTDVYTSDIEHNDRSILEGETHPGFVRIYCNKGTDKIVGAICVSSRGGEMISEVVLAMTQDIGLFQIGRAIHSYPTLSEAVMGAGLAFIRTRWDHIP